MNAAQLLVKCLENEGVEYIFGIPGEENLDIMDALLDSPITFVTVRHEQGAAFMADVYGRLTGKAGVCMSTLGPGATNLITGVADANMDHAPIVAIAGQGATTRLHKESHQILDLVNLFTPITKYATQILEPEIVPEVVRKAFKLAQEEKPGGAFIDFPENVAEMAVDASPLPVRKVYTPAPLEFKVEQAARLIGEARHPIIIAGNGVIRQEAATDLVNFAEQLRIPVCNTFMAKGVMPFSNPLSLGTLGLKARDLPWYAVEKADVVICVGYDMVEYHPDMWNPNNAKTIVHIDALSAEVDAHYSASVECLGHIPSTFRAGEAAAQGAVLGRAPRDHRRARSARRRYRLSGQAAEDRLGSARSAGPGRYRHLRRRRAQDVDGAHVPRRAAEYLHHLQRLRLDGYRGAGCARGQARAPGT